jgi:hypothetical protein
MDKISLTKRKEILEKLYLTAHPLSDKTRCLKCGNARLQINTNEELPEEYASPAMIKDFVKKLEINIICTATAQTQIKLAQVTHCELFELCSDD